MLTEIYIEALRVDEKLAEASLLAVAELHLRRAIDGHGNTSRKRMRQL